ncbi:hypothetical protein ACLOAV_008163 [Pseudogymnoascus australis]
MTEASTPQLAEKSSYHHFIPQFILKNFGYKYRPLTEVEMRQKAKQGIYPGNILGKGICLTGPDAALVDTKISRTFGVQDLYADAANSTDKEHIEKLLSGLERSASKIIAQVRSKHDDGEKLIVLNRAEKDVLRKFLFIMKYRRPNVRDKYACSIEDFDGAEKDELQKYMRQKGFQRPLDVWLNNIKAMLEIKIDAGCKWEKVLMQKAYPPDAAEFIVHTRLFYLSFCSPSDENDEFLMTENSYGIHEGPKSTMVDPNSGRVVGTFYTEYHTFAHIAPNLTMILRSFLLPSPGDVSSEDIRKSLEMLRELNISMHDFPERATSFLKDLPVAKARNSYTRMVNGRVVPRREGSVLGPKDKFYFRVFRISTDHVDKINMILLDEAWPTSLILFKTERSARSALEHYLTLDPLSTSHGLKLIFPTETLREAYFRKLECAVRLLNGNVSATYRFDDGTLEGVLTRDEDQLIDLVSQNDEVLQAYYKISNKEVLDRDDFKQSREMLKQRIKIDTRTRGRDEEFRNKAREDLIHQYWEFPPQQLWIFLKRERFLMHGGTILGLRSDVHDHPLPAELLPGPEDVIARMSEIFHASHLSRMMYFATMNHIKFSNPESGVFKELDLDDEGARRLKEERSIVFGKQGSICDCGILPIEIIAKEIQASFQEAGMTTLDTPPVDPTLKLILDGVLDSKERLEMATRLTVKDFFMDVIKLKDDIFNVLFNIIFPVFFMHPMGGKNET